MSGTYNGEEHRRWADLSYIGIDTITSIEVDEHFHVSHDPFCDLSKISETKGGVKDADSTALITMSFKTNKCDGTEWSFEEHLPSLVKLVKHLRSSDLDGFNKYTS